jgi:hypothetical protein
MDFFCSRRNGDEKVSDMDRKVCVGHYLATMVVGWVVCGEQMEPGIAQSVAVFMVKVEACLNILIASLIMQGW